MAYSRVDWRNEITPVNADNMNRIEDGIEENIEGISALNTRADGLSDRIDGLIDVFYPVGSYYETSDASFDPNTAWGGTWAKDSAGRVTVAIDTKDAALDTIGETGGSKFIQAHTHTLSNHTHGLNNHTHYMQHQHPAITYRNNAAGGSARRTPYGYDAGQGDGSLTTGWGSRDYTDGNNGNTTGPSAANTSDVQGASTGNAGNMQPYIVVNRWHRTA